MNKLISIIKDNKAVNALLEKKDNVLVNDIYDEALLISSAFLKSKQPLLVIKPNFYEANMLYELVSGFLNEDVLFFGSDESFRVEALASSPELQRQRIMTLSSLVTREPKVLIGHVHSVIRYVPSKETFVSRTIDLAVSQRIGIDNLQTLLVEAGYKRAVKADQMMYYARRGGIIDIYPVNFDHPVRIDFFDDEIDEIRFFNEENNRSIEKVNNVRIIPASDVLYDRDFLASNKGEIEKLRQGTLPEVLEQYRDDFEEMVAIEIENLKSSSDATMYKYYSLDKTATSIFDYLEGYQVVLGQKEAIDQSYLRYVEENFNYYLELVTIGKAFKDLDYFLDYTKLVKDHTCIENFSLEPGAVTFNTRRIQERFDNENILLGGLKGYLNSNRVLICVENGHQSGLMSEFFERHGLQFSLVGTKDVLNQGINLYAGTIPFGVELLDEKVAIITAKEIFVKTATKIKHFQYKEAKMISSYQDLSVGDYVVHDNHGIGQYLGIKTLQVQGYSKDYLHVAYAHDDKLYIPVEQFKLIRKYSSASGKVPALHSLGDNKWQRTKQKIKNQVDDIAEGLIEIYSQRLKQVGFVFPEDNQEQLDFESEFGYELTRDQLRSVAEIKKDMQSPLPMDRLLCGDVGFGKTEVAFRAAFKACNAGKQVAYLCPTTILSMQHYNTAKARFKNTPVNIALLNRFTSAKEKKAILEGVKTGLIDFVIGTHRILSKDIEFKDIGLLIIDEEQRFGVKQKEAIKQYRKTIDVLTLSATPIPRTLHMSLMGIRGFSQINTPPNDRLPVQTYVIEKNNTLVKQVIERELARNGQVFYLFNDVSRIHNLAFNLQQMLPKARIAIGHGQMSKAELERVMVDFVNHEYDILVCTTIIETGIDITNANTMIVEDADHFGLSQLYQIKGRVGRGRRTSYAYLMYQKNKILNEEASKRLKAIKEFTELGSGYKIAMRDLSIRGSGDILGGSQSGYIDTVGFDMYMKILQEAIQLKKDGLVKKPKEKNIITTSLKLDGYIPEEYIDSDIEKLELYQKIEGATTIKTIDALKNEFLDFYGHLPEVVENLVLKRKLDILATDQNIEDILNEDDFVVLVFKKEFAQKIKGDEFFVDINRLFTKPRFKQFEGKITVSVKNDENVIRRIIELLGLYSLS